MPKIHLISHHLCPYVQRAVIVLSEKNITHERTYIDLANKPDWFQAMSPLGRVPLLEIEDTVLFESQVIAEYLDETTPGSLYPDDALDKARHRAWIEFGSETLAAIGGFYNAEDATSFSAKRVTLRYKFERINEEIAGPYFAGETFHMIDGVWGTIFRYFDVFDQIADFGILTDLKAVQDWRKAVSIRPSVVAAPPEGYAERLGQFLQRKDSFLGVLARGNGKIVSAS
jgi:glutathione S-transferase